MDRRTFGLSSILACSMTTQAFGLTSETNTEQSSSCDGFRFGVPVERELKSMPIKWQGGDVHLVTLNRFTFLLDEQTNRLTAKAEGSLLTFDDVEYSIGLVVCGENESLLGASTAVCKVPRIWVGAFLKQPIDLTLDFGISNNYSNAKHFQCCISDRTVLTPRAIAFAASTENH
jgi:hypothetical protein